MKKPNGITLIALVITIIVLLILAGISITTVMGENGIVQKALDAKEKTNAAKAAEEQELGSGKIKIDGKWYNNIDDYIAGKPLEDGSGEDTGEGGNPEGGIQIELSIAGEKVTTVPLPSEDFEHVEGTIEEGYVIRHKTDENEFVWVPVDKNQKITLKITSDKDIKSVKLREPFGEVKLTLTDDQIEKSYINTQIEPTVNGMYFATVETEEETVQETLIVRSLYAYDAWNDYYTSEEYIEFATGGAYSKDEYCEALITYYTEYESVQGAMDAEGCFSIEELLTIILLKHEYKDIVDYSGSVNQHGGFYIGRYEAGTGNSNDLYGTRLW